MTSSSQSSCADGGHFFLAGGSARLAEDWRPRFFNRYQRHVYKVDMSRVNEFGQRGDAPAAGDEKGGEKQKRDEKGGAGGAKKKGREQAQESKKDK